MKTDSAHVGVGKKIREKNIRVVIVVLKSYRGEWTTKILSFGS